MINDAETSPDLSLNWPFLGVCEGVSRAAANRSSVIIGNRNGDFD